MIRILLQKHLLRYLYVIHSTFMIMYEKLAFVAVTNASLTNGSMVHDSLVLLCPWGEH